MHIFAGKFKNRTLQAPKGSTTRPTSGRLREAVFNICQTYIDGSEFLDLFAGSGAMGLEALSRGAVHATFIDNSKDSTRCIQSNVQHFNVEEMTEVLGGDVFLMLERLKKHNRQFDIIYVDPPYDSPSSYSERIIHLIDSSDLLKNGGNLFIEDSTASMPTLGLWQHLKHKSSRKMGRTVLHQFGKI